MARFLLAAVFGAALVSTSALASQPDADGFTRPLDALKFNPGLDQQEFERASLDALNVYDPWEPMNRRFYHFNYRFDQWVFLPTVKFYRKITPSPLRTGVSNFFKNLGEIPTLANSVLQGKGHRAMNATARLLFNSILGVGGLWDPATKMGLPRQPEDFGQTLGFYGVPSGPYLMVPLFGPSNLRDLTGTTADYGLGYSVNFMDYTRASHDNPGLLALRAIDARAGTAFGYGQLNSPFEYEKVRYLYNEVRKLQINE